MGSQGEGREVSEFLVSFSCAIGKHILSFADLVILCMDYVNDFHRISVFSTDARINLYHFYLHLLHCD